MSKKPSRLTALQTAFCDNLRYQANATLPDNVDKDSMALYQELNFHNIESAVSPCFPVATKVVDKTLWHDLVKRFMHQYQISTPYYHDLPKAFIEFVAREPAISEYPYLLELLDYEWLELHVELTDADISNRLAPPTEAVFEQSLQLSPLAKMRTYHYPLDIIGPDNIPEKAEPFSVIVYRDKEDAVHFMRINEVTETLIKLIDHDGFTPLEAMLTLHQSFPDMKQEDFLAFAGGTVFDLVKASILVLKQAD